MSLTYTPQSQLKTMPDFQLSTVDGHKFGIQNIPQGFISVVLFICNHCPYVQAIEDRLTELAHSLKSQTVQFIGVCSNDYKDHPEDHPERLLERWQNKNYGFPYLLDVDQNMAKAFGAVCTPDIFVFDANKSITYRGRFDNSWKDSKKVTKEDLKVAILKTLQGEKIEQQIPSMGCSIKWNS